MASTKFGFNMADDDNHLNPDWSANGSHENTGDELNELKMEMIALKVFKSISPFDHHRFLNQAKVQVLETENKQLQEEKKIQEDKCSKLEKEMREKTLKRVGTISKNSNTKNKSL
jgi:hypothetical protein